MLNPGDIIALPTGYWCVYSVGESLAMATPVHDFDNRYAQAREFARDFGDRPNVRYLPLNDKYIIVDAGEKLPFKVGQDIKTPDGMTGKIIGLHIGVCFVWFSSETYKLCPYAELQHDLFDEIKLGRLCLKKIGAGLWRSGPYKLEQVPGSYTFHFGGEFICASPSLEDVRKQALGYFGEVANLLGGV